MFFFWAFHTPFWCRIGSIHKLSINHLFLLFYAPLVHPLKWQQKSNHCFLLITLLFCFAVVKIRIETCAILLWHFLCQHLFFFFFRFELKQIQANLCAEVIPGGKHVSFERIAARFLQQALRPPYPE